MCLTGASTICGLLMPFSSNEVTLVQEDRSTHLQGASQLPEFLHKRWVWDDGTLEPRVFSPPKFLDYYIRCYDGPKGVTGAKAGPLRRQDAEYGPYS